MARACWALLIALGVLLLTPGAAAAHAVLVRAAPGPGARVGAVPGAVVLTYDEPLIPRLSAASVVAPGGRRFAGRVSRASMRVPLGGGVRGVYRVTWRTVSRVDGHTITGGFRFGVGAAPGSTVFTPAPTVGDTLIAALRAVEYAALLLACGFAVLHVLGGWARLPVVPVAAALLAAGVLVVGAEAVVAGAGVAARGFADYLGNGLTGWARVARIGAEAAVLGVALVRRRLPLGGLAVIVTAVAVAGHGADVEPAWQGIAVNAVHLAAAGVWAGGIMALAVLRATGRWPDTGAVLLPRFSRVAPWAFGVSVAAGILQAAQLLGGPTALTRSAYGVALLIKALTVAAMLPLSVLAWPAGSQLWRRIFRAIARKILRHNWATPDVRAEAVLALVVVAAAAVLAAFPVVPKEAAEAGRAARAVPARLAPYPGPRDLTLGGHAGPVTVGLTVRPGRPGPNRILVYLADPATRSTRARIRADAGPATPTRTAPAAARADGRWRELAFCGPQCRTATLDLRGGERLRVGVGGRTAVFALPALPAADGSGLAAAAMARMDRLRTYRVHETLSGIRSAYLYARPHRMWLRTWYGDGPQDTLWLGRALYRRDRPSAPYKLSSRGLPAPVPAFVWSAFRPLTAVRILGESPRMTRVAAFGGHGRDPEPVWLTLWIDKADGRILRSQMWAPLHAMDDRYTAFDRPAHFPRPGR